VPTEPTTNSFESYWDLEDLREEADSYSDDGLDWYENDNNARVVGIDWISETIYIIDPDSPNYPSIEIAQFSGIDVLFTPKQFTTEQESN
jgi:hypothetical protein